MTCVLGDDASMVRAAVLLDRKDYLIEVHKQLSDNDVYQEFSSDLEDANDALGDFLANNSKIRGFHLLPKIHEVRNSRVKKSSCETELRKMTSHFELLTRRFLWKFFFRITNSTL